MWVRFPQGTFIVSGNDEKSLPFFLVKNYIYNLVLRWHLDAPQDNLDVQILKLMCANDKISTESIAKTLGVSSKTIKRRIKEMDNVRYIGSGYSGHWEIIEC